MNNSNYYCVIMAGGVGSRFWPLSTSKFPKQFQDILGVGRTMIQQTFDRVSPLIKPENIFVITSREHMPVAAQQLPELPAENIVGEPMMKNTAACNLYMAKKIKDINPDAVILVTPSDHLVTKEETFRKKINLALDEAAKNDILVTIGITPTRPETGYGYIQFVQGDSEISAVKTFTEKPDLEIAKTFLESGEFLWNAGIFVWSAKCIVESFKKYLPEMEQSFEECKFNTTEEAVCIDRIYPQVNKVSIDNGIMEKAENVFVIPADLGWSDLGTWTSVYENSEKDEDMNADNGRYLLHYNSSGNIIHIKNRNKAVIVDGLQDYILVDTDKALIVCPRANDQLIKEYVSDLRTIKKGEKFV